MINFEMLSLQKKIEEIKKVFNEYDNNDMKTYQALDRIRKIVLD
jgi:hypothetical protein